MKPKKEKNDEDWFKLFGAWESDPKTAEELIFELREHRYTNRKIETFD